MIDSMFRAAWRGSVTLVVFAVVAGATGCGSESSRSSQTTTSAPRVGTKYISKRYGYEIVLSGKYAMIPAQLPWDGSFPFGASGRVDEIVDQTQDRKFIVGAKPVPSRMSLRRWAAFVMRVQQQFCARLRHFRVTTLGGVQAREFLNTCPGYEVITLAALHRGRGYLVNYLRPSTSSEASGRRTYEAGRRAFAFTQN